MRHAVHLFVSLTALTSCSSPAPEPAVPPLAEAAPSGVWEADSSSLALRDSMVVLREGTARASLPSSWECTPLPNAWKEDGQPDSSRVAQALMTVPLDSTGDRMLRLRLPECPAR